MFIADVCWNIQSHTQLIDRITTELRLVRLDVRGEQGPMGSSGLVESGSGRARGRSSRARGLGPCAHDDSPWGSGPGRDGGGRPQARPFRLDPSDVRGVQDRARSASRVHSTSPRPGSQASARSHEAPAPALMPWPDAEAWRRRRTRGDVTPFIIISYSLR